MRRMESPRPLTHELFIQVLQRVRIDVDRRAPHRPGSGELPGRARPDGAERARAHSCRPSDGLVLALRMPVPAPILVDERLLESSADVVPQAS